MAMNLGHMYASLGVKTRGFRQAQMQMQRFQKQARVASTRASRSFTEFTRTASIKTEIFRNRTARRVVASLGMISDAAKTKMKSFAVSFKQGMTNAAKAVKIKMGGAFDSLKGFEDQLKNLASHALRAGERLMRLGFYTGMYLTLPLLGAGAATLAFQKRFGAVMNRVQNLLGATQDQTAEFKRQIMDLGPKTGQGPFAFARSLELVMQEGIDASKAMGVVEKAAKATSITGQRNMSQLAQAIANVTAAMEVSPGKAAGFVTKLVGEEGMRQAFRISTTIGEIASNAKSLGVELKTLGGVLGVIGDEGRLSWRIANDLDNVFNDLLETAEKGKPRINALRNELRGLIRQKGLIPFLTRIKEELGTVAFQDLFSKSSLKVLRGLVSVLPKLSKETGKWVNLVAYLEEKFKGVQGTVQFQFQQAVSTLESTFVKFGQVIKGPMIYALNWLNEQLQNLMNTIHNLSKEQINNILAWVKWVAGIGPVFMALGLVVTLIGSTISAFQKLAHVIRYMALTPWGLLATAIILVGQWLFRLIRASRKEKKQMEELATATKKYGEIMDAAGRVGLNATDMMRRNRAEIGIYKDRLQDVSEEIRNQKNRLGALQKGTADYKIAAAKLNALEDRKQRLISTINRKYGDYLDTNLKMSMSYNEMARQLNKVNKEMLKAVKITAYKKAMADVQKKIVDISFELSKLEDKWKETFQKQKAVKGQTKMEVVVSPTGQAMTRIINEGDKYARQLDNLEEKQLNRQERLRALKEQMQRLMDLMAKEGLLTEENTKKQEKQNKTLKEYQDIVKEGNIQRAKSLADAYKEFAKQAENATNKQKDFAEKLKYAGNMQKALGDNFNYNRYMANLYKEEIEKLIQKEEINWKKVNKLRKGYELFQNKLNETTKNVAEKTNIMASLMEGAFRRVQSAITDALRNTSGEAKSFGKIIGDILKNLFYRIVSTAIAAFAFSAIISSILPGLGSMKLFGTTLGKGTNFSDIFGLLFSQGAGRMQKGGVVPPGYPNDSYPAMLTSGETVIPPDDLDKNKIGGTTIYPEVIGVKGETFYIAFKEYERRKNNTL